MKSFLASITVCALLLATACSQSPEKLLATANKYHDNKKYDEASILYQKILIKDKTNAEAYYRLGLNLISQLKLGEAAQALRRAVDLKPSNTDAESKLADIYLGAYATAPDKSKLKSYLGDVKDLDDKILKQDPNSFDGLRIHGELHLVNNDLPDAVQDFQKANSVKPYTRDLTGMYALSLFQSGKKDEAVSLLTQAIAHDKTWGGGYDLLYGEYMQTGQRDKAEAILKQHVDADPADAGAIVRYANYRLASGDFAGAEQIMKRTLNDPKAFPNGQMLMGNFYEQANKRDQAMAAFQQGEKDDSKNAVKYQERIIALKAASNHSDEALKMAKDVADKNPKEASAARLYAELLLRSTTAASAPKTVEEVKHLLENNPGDSMLHLDLARAYFGSKEPDKSLTEAQTAITNERKSTRPNAAVVVQAQTLTARIYSDRGDPDSEHKALEQAQLVLDERPGDPDAMIIKDRALIATGEVEKAQVDLEALVQRFPNLVEAHIQLANVYMRERQYDKSTEQFAAASKLTPNDMRGAVGAQQVKLYSGHTADAIQGMQDLLSKNPGNLAVRFELANFQATAASMPANHDQAAQLFQQAADNYKEILKTNATSADIWLRLGMVQRVLGQSDAALASFEQAGNSNRNNTSAFLLQAQLLEGMNRKKEAIDAYNKVINIEPNNALALNNLAYMSAETGANLNQAQTYAEHAKKEQPNSPDIADTLGYVYLQKNLNSQAAEIFRQNVTEHPENPNFRFHLAMALLKVGDKQGAKEQAAKALDSANTNPDLQTKIKAFVGQIG